MEIINKGKLAELIADKLSTPEARVTKKDSDAFVTGLLAVLEDQFMEGNTVKLLGIGMLEPIVRTGTANGFGGEKVEYSTRGVKFKISETLKKKMNAKEV